MGNLACRKSDKSEHAWKQQNMEMEINRAYEFANLSRGGKLIDAYNEDGPEKVEEIARNEMSDFFYHPEGNPHKICKKEFAVWLWNRTQHGDVDDTEKIDEDKIMEEYKDDYFNRHYDHKACWDLAKRGGVGETPFHLLYLMDSPVHFEVAKTLLKIYPALSLDVYEGEEYFGESSLHIAIVVGDFESVTNLIEAGADVHQRATGRFFLPEDQKKCYTGDTNYYGYAYYGEYALAFAACFGNTDVYDYLLHHGANPNLQDSFGNTVLHMVVIADQPDMYKYAVRHYKKRADATIKNNQNLTPLTLACKLGRHSIFKEMLDLESIEFWRFSTTMCSAHPLRTLDSIGPDGNTNWDSALMIIVNGEKDEHLEMLTGGVMRQLLDEKWKTFAQNRFIWRLIVAVIKLVLFSAAIYLRPSGPDLLGYRGTADVFRYIAEVLVCISCLVTLYYEIREISTQGFSSFSKNCVRQFQKTHAPAQTVYLLSCLLILMCIPFRIVGLYNAEDILLIMAAPCAWFFLLFFARGVRLTGPFVTMIYEMCSGDLVRFALIYLIFLIGFTQGFFFLFRDVPADNDDVQKFSTFPETILNLFQMTLGEFKYESFNLSHYAPLTKIIFALFMVLVPILLLNMLIAMMGNTYTQVISKSEKEWRKQWAKIVVVLERGISTKKLLAYQQSYSVRLPGAPPPPGSVGGPVEERALVVIKQSSRSKAKTRKTAIYHWKMLGKEVVRQLRKKRTGGQPFVLTESMRRKRGAGLASDDQSDQMNKLSATVAQLAWEQDIDLTKGQADTPSDTPRVSTVQASPTYLQNGSAVKEPSKIVAPHLKTESDVKSPLRKRRNLVYNRVSPLLSPHTVKEEASFSDISEENAFQEDSMLTEVHPSDRSQEGSPRKMSIIADDQGQRIVQSEFSLSAESSSASDSRHDVVKALKHRRRTSRTQSREGTPDSQHPKSDKEGSAFKTKAWEETGHTSSSSTIKVQDLEFGVMEQAPSTSVSWLEESPPIGFEVAKRKKKSRRDKSKSRSRKSGHSSESSVTELLDTSKEKEGDYDDTNV